MPDYKAQTIEQCQTKLKLQREIVWAFGFWHLEFN
jgi:hypothetical protein